MYIAPNFTVKDWSNLNLKSSEPDWQIAINAFDERIRSRYIEPVDHLINIEKDLSPKNRRFGFTCIAIDMLLIETLQAFKEGLTDSKGQSKALFERFLASSDRFNIYFTNKMERDLFYQEFRCGILHQAEVQGTALLWSVGDLYDRSKEPHTLNRVFFHQELKKEFEDYVSLLKSHDSVGLRDLFRRKMESITSRVKTE